MPEHVTPKPEHFTGFKKTTFAPPLLSWDCFSHPSFVSKLYHWVGAAAKLLPGTAQHQEAVLLLLQFYSRHSTSEERADGRANGSAEDSSGQDFSPFSANWPELGFNFVQWTYGSQGSICLNCCSLSGSQTTTALIWEKLQPNFWGP